MLRIRGDAGLIIRDLIFQNAELIPIPCCHLPNNKVPVLTRAKLRKLH